MLSETTDQTNGVTPSRTSHATRSSLTEDPRPQTTMRITKRNGTSESVDVNKIVRAVNRCCVGLPHVDTLRVATKTISGLYDGATTRELDQLSIQTAAGLIADEPQYAKLAARLLATYVDKEVCNQGIYAFSQSVGTAQKLGLVGNRLLSFVTQNARKLNDAIVPERDHEFEYFGLRTVYDRYLLKHPKTRLVLETPQQFFLRIACSLSETVTEALELYRLFSMLEYLPSSPTLFNAGTKHEQLSSCFLLDSPDDHLENIYQRYTDVALLSKFSGGIGLAYHRVRSRGSLIESTNGLSSGIVPWLKTLDASVAAVNQGGKRKGACCVYLEPWHADIEEFLELRDNTGDDAKRAHNLNLANWVPDLFMKRVEADGDWSLFDPRRVPALPDLYGDDFELRYAEAERAGLAQKTVKARDLYARMMRTLAQTGNGWMTFKDKSNRACNQTALPGRTVHLSNLCTEILEVTSKKESAVCNLGSINLGRHTITDRSGAVTFDFDKLAATARAAVRQLDRVIDLNFYPIASARTSNLRWRPVGLGIMGLQDVFFQMRLPFDAPDARALSRRIAEEIYFHALSASVDLALEKGRHPAFDETRAARGELQFEAWGVQPEDTARWEMLRQRIRQHGLRNSLLVAIAPTATIASRAPQALRRLGAGHGGDPGRAPGDLPHSVGGPDAFAHRHGRRPRRVHRPESVAESLHRDPKHRSALQHVLLRMEKGPQDHLLPSLASGDAHREGHGRSADGEGLDAGGQSARATGMDAAAASCRGPGRAGRRCRGLLAREPRELRGMPVSATRRPARLLDPGMCLTLRPMVYPAFFEMYRNAIKNTWSVEEVDFATDTLDLQKKMTGAETHLVRRLVAFFATGDSIVSNNLVLNLYKHINAPEARMYLSRQLYEEALHVQFYLTLLDTYVPDPEERHHAFAAVETIPSIQKKAAFCTRWMDSIQSLDRLETRDHRRQFLLNLICFAACVEGLFFFGAFAYVYFLRSRGLLHGLAAGTSWVFRDESAHMAFAFEVVRTVRHEEPDLFDAELTQSAFAMLDQAIECETQFAEDLLGTGVVGLSVESVRRYLEFCADQRLITLGLPKRYGTKNPLSFMDLQDVQEVTNFFERRVSSYQVGVRGEVVLDGTF